MNIFSNTSKVLNLILPLNLSFWIDFQAFINVYPSFLRATMIRGLICLASVLTVAAGLHGKDTSVCNGDPVSSGELGADQEGVFCPYLKYFWGIRYTVKCYITFVCYYVMLNISLFYLGFLFIHEDVHIIRNFIANFFDSISNLPVLFSATGFWLF